MLVNGLIPGSEKLFETAIVDLEQLTRTEQSMWRALRRKVLNRKSAQQIRDANRARVTKLEQQLQLARATIHKMHHQVAEIIPRLAGAPVAASHADIKKMCEIMTEMYKSTIFDLTQ